MTDDEIREKARKFLEEVLEPFFANSDKKCPVCGRDNCINNDRCIGCGCQF
jgi:transposase